MEIMPYSERNNVTAITERLPLAQNHSEAVSTDWREQLPVLSAKGVTLRELTLEDAPALLAMLTTEEVSRFISPPPTTVEGFERFIAWTRRQREAGQYVCFGVVPEGMTTAVGLFQVRSMEPGFASAEWGFVIGSPYWGTGLFMAGAELVLEIRVQDDWRVSSRGPVGRAERPRERRPAEAGRGTGRRAAESIPPAWDAPRSEHLVHPGQRMDTGQGDVGAARGVGLLRRSPEDEGEPSRSGPIGVGADLGRPVGGASSRPYFPR
jgi:RimJ/RimL family protein N-acetyltransferase